MSLKSIWALGDLHLSFSTPEKDMARFGWVDYTNVIEKAWKECVEKDDIVLIPGDISWAMRLEKAVEDLQWIAHLPGKKILCRGNHDYWWTSLKKMNALFPNNMYFIHNSAVNMEGLSFGGTRLWDCPDFSFGERALEPETDESGLYEKELDRLELSLKAIDPNARVKVALCHYPPLSADLKESRATLLFERYGINTCVFGHLHGMPKDSLPFGTRNGISYHLVSCDYVSFCPKKVLGFEA